MKHWWQTKVLKRRFWLDKYGTRVYLVSIGYGGARVGWHRRGICGAEFHTETWVWSQCAKDCGKTEDEFRAWLGLPDEEALKEAGMTAGEWWASRNG